MHEPHWDDALLTLGQKYDALLVLRGERDTFEAQGRVVLSKEEDDLRKQKMAELALRFPGALRELETHNVDVLQHRRQAIEEAKGRSSETIPTWIRVTYDYHRLMRQTLRIKRWLADHSHDRERFLKWFADCPERCMDVDAFAEPWLEEIADPPHGKLTVWVWNQIAPMHHSAPEILKLMVFG